LYQKQIDQTKEIHDFATLELPNLVSKNLGILSRSVNYSQASFGYSLVNFIIGFFGFSILLCLIPRVKIRRYDTFTVAKILTGIGIGLIILSISSIITNGIDNSNRLSALAEANTKIINDKLRIEYNLMAEQNETGNKIKAIFNLLENLSK
jgi:hypothetical protein